MLIENPYAHQKPYPYKASLHNHTMFTPAYDHAPVLSSDRLREYRDYETTPPYGIVAITEHDRLSTPWNTNPPCDQGVYEYKHTDPPWGVNGILWLPGMERIIGRRDGSDEKLFGEIVCLNCRPELMEKEPRWEAEPSPHERSGWFYHTRSVPASAELTFVGTGIRWIARTYDATCIAKVLIDGEEVGTVDLFSRETRFQQVVFEALDLSPGVHTVRIVQTDDKNPNNTNRFVQDLTLDTLVVVKSDGSEVDYGANHPEIRYTPLRHRYDPRPDERAHEVVAQLRQDGVYVILSHPNARLETSGEFEGTQIWSSAGYTYDELDTMFGNANRGQKSWPYLPNALEIGNLGYDLTGGRRTNWTNAEEKWDYLLNQGHRVHGTASDDSHGQAGLGGWVVIYTNAAAREELTVDDVMESLFQGNFYASQGPTINSIRVEENMFIIETDLPGKIEFISNGEVIKAAENVVRSDYTFVGNEGYVRARVTREDKAWREIDGGIGHRRSAWTNPIFVSV